jgi:DNA-binding transcriptional LysR family regulator
MDMSWAALRSLRDVARYGTITEAARAQGYTPGAVTQQLAALQRSVGRPLLVRVGRHVQLTDAGRVLVVHADHMLRCEQDARAAVEATDQDASGLVTIATFATFAAALLPRSIQRAATSHPDLSIRTLELDVDQVAEAVRHGEADLAFGLDYPDAPVPQAPGVESLPIASERLSIGTVEPMTSADASVRLADFADRDWILPPADTNYGRAIRDACRRAGFEPHPAHIVNDTAVTLMLAAQGLGVTMTTPMMLALQPAPGLVRSPLVEDVRRELVLFQRTSSYRRPAVIATKRIIEAVVQRFTTEATDGVRLAHSSAVP